MQHPQKHQQQQQEEVDNNNTASTTNNWLDHVSKRVVLSGVGGAVAGSFTAVYRGHYSTFRTASLTALSCALVGTACFGTERLVYHALTRMTMMQPQQPTGANGTKQNTADVTWPSSYVLSLVSHAVGGLLGGAYIGAAYSNRPGRGALMMAPLMMGIVVVEEQYKQKYTNVQ